MRWKLQLKGVWQMVIKKYDRASAAQYAQRWALGRNPKYYDFEGIGGDCTNFISQCVYAGSGIMNYTPVFGWYYISSSQRTASWTGVQYFYNFLTQNKSVGPFASEVPEEKAEPGDVIQLGGENGVFYHTLMITATQPEILVCAHTFDALDRPLSSYYYFQSRFLHIEGVRAWQ